MRIALANFEYSSMRTLISGAHGNQHSPELTTPTQWKDSALAQSQNSPQNESASCCMHIAAFTYHPTTTHHASKLPFLLKKKKKIFKNKSMKANFKASSKQNQIRVPTTSKSTMGYIRANNADNEYFMSQNYDVSEKY